MLEACQRTSGGERQRNTEVRWGASGLSWIVWVRLGSNWGAFRDTFWELLGASLGLLGLAAVTLKMVSKRGAQNQSWLIRSTISKARNAAPKISPG